MSQSCPLDNTEQIGIAMRKKALVTCLVSIIICICAAEIVIRHIAPQNLSSSFLVQDQNGLWLNKPDSKVVHRGGKSETIVYSFDKTHLRESPSQSAAKKVLCLGDSFTFGWLLKEDETYPYLLEEMALKEFGAESFQFLNGAVGGWGTSSYLAFLEHYGQIIKPDIVLVFLNTDDIGRSIKSEFYRLADDQSVQFSPKPEQVNKLKKILNFLPFYDYLLTHSHFVQFLRYTYVSLRYPKPKYQEENSPPSLIVPGSNSTESSLRLAPKLGQALFRKMKQWCKENKCRLLVTTTGIHLRSNKNDPTTVFMKSAPQFFKTEGIDFHDISLDFEQKTAKEGIKNYFRPHDFHPNKRGAALIAETVWSWLKEKLARTNTPGE